MNIKTWMGAIVAWVLIVAPATAMAQKQFTLEDLNFGGNNYQNMIPQNKTLTWWGDKLVHIDKLTCSIVNLDNGKETPFISTGDLNQWAALQGDEQLTSMRGVSFPYAHEPIVMVETHTTRILVDFKKKEVVYSALFDQGIQAEEFNLVGRNSAWVKDGNLYVNDEQVTTDGSREIVYGQAVHRNEFGIDGGMFWSPDGQQIAFYRMDQSMVTDYPQVDIPALDAPNGQIATPAPDKYPMAGQPSHKVTVGVYSVLTGRTIYLQAGDPTDRYFTNITWSPDSKLIYMFELNRDQNDCRLVSYDATTGAKAGELYRETQAKYVEPQHPIVFLPWNPGKFIMQSQKDGWNHLYLFDQSGKELKQITSGHWVVMQLMGFEAKGHNVIIASNEAGSLQRNLYRVNLDNGQRTRIDQGGKGWHYGTLSESGTCMVDNYQEPDVPRKVAMVNTTTGQATTFFTAPNPWAGYKVPTYESGSIKAADGVTDLYYRLVKPADFDPAKKYPTVVYVYGGPHAHNVDARWHWGSRSWETYMAQKGYVLFILDNRGSENRGRDFEQATFRQLGQIEMQDQMKGVEFLRNQAYVDTARLGVHGWSFGGFMTISLMTRYPDVFKVGVAGGPVIDWKWYEVMYGERYMDTPQANPEGYAKASLLDAAKNLKGRLQIIIGYNDPTVVPQHALSFLKACIAAGTQPDFYVYPGQGHNMRGHQSVHLHERITRYFEDYLK